MNRRDILKLGVGFGALSVSSSAFGRGLNYFLKPGVDQKFLVFIELMGGWDVTLGLDPWLLETRPDPKDMFIEYRADEIKKGENIFLGPSAFPLLPHLKDLSVINGVFVSRLDQGHPGARDYMLSGGSSSNAAGFVLEAMHSGHQGPYGVISDLSFPFGERAVVKSGIETIKSQIDSVNFSEILEKIVVEGTESELLEAQRRVLESTDQVLSMNAHLKSLLSQGVTLDSQHVLAAAFLSGVSSQGQIDVGVNLDTHASHSGNHLSEQRTGFEKVAEVFRYFKSIEWGNSGRSLFDQTLFVVTSEFSRTPYLNAADGKDHNPLTNSVILAGSGIRGGQTLGGSQLVPKARSRIGSAYHIARPIDLKAGQVASGRNGAGFIFPENVLKTAALALDLDLSKIESFDPSVAALPWILYP